jgi:hypothetical protein
VIERELVEVLALREREVVNVTLDGPRYAKHSADILTLSDVLKRIQRLFTGIVQTITEGPTRRGPVSAGVDALSRLRLATVFPSSFGMSVEVDTRPDLFGYSRSVAALETLFALLDVPASRAELLSRLSEVGPRAATHYRSLINTLLKTETAVSVMWTDPVGNAFDWGAEPNKLADLHAILSSIHSGISESKTATGMLLGASLLRNRFEFLTDPPEELLAGRITQDARESVRALFGQYCRLEYQETRVADDVSGDVRTAIVMTRVEPFDKTREHVGLN